MEFFGFEIRRKEDEKKNLDAVTPVLQDDGSLVVAAGGSYGMYVDIECHWLSPNKKDFCALVIYTVLFFR